MGYQQLLKLVNIMDNKLRLESFARIYREKQLEGLHYTSFLPDKNIVSISRPDHTTVHEATSFLISRKSSGKAINTVRNEANDLKKFLDFMLIWEIELLKSDLLVVLEGFTDYLQLIRTDVGIEDALEWATLKEVPLNIWGKSVGKVSGIQRDEFGKLQRSDISSYSSTSINKIVRTAVQYIQLLKKKSSYHASLKINELPHRSKKLRGFISSTAGNIQVATIDILSITRDVGVKIQYYGLKRLKVDSIFTLEQTDQFIESASSFQDKLLFNILRFIGPRASEAAGIWIDPTSVPNNLLRMDYHKAKRLIKQGIEGDIDFYEKDNKGFWVCRIKDRDNPDFRSGHKRDGEYREIPWLFSQEGFLNLLYEALRERQILMRNIEVDHGYLFVSRNRRNQGQPITGKAIAKKYENINRQLIRKRNIDLSEYSPHTFRHFYATYLFKKLNIQIDDVSRWLGHRSTETTRTIYSHWIPSSNSSENDGTVQNILETFKPNKNKERE
ncbi:tyrosine-type recombinase/integrase [Paenibacillus chondroitinus]|uniref:Tyrosine-type recombinase/integrase n=1 Tax=Paenibacillus chondroitinus TaxID=59842 RepID=A0ABU6D856_9BACL|nr:MULTISPECIES: tyrosine-type recombinase/integrase [Paenibacillus]MCY9661965.1 tyrosine-type recombinase/integrase [Paenibacillus anseongense]MEB4793651.1 tyrosine-type recombinase/integrase [Paenibacillus chondroitinus]